MMRRCRCEIGADCTKISLCELTNLQEEMQEILDAQQEAIKQLRKESDDWYSPEGTDHWYSREMFVQLGQLATEQRKALKTIKEKAAQNGEDVSYLLAKKALGE